ncbi:GNAT family N-acetyltransferase [Diaminobutyricibacter sp. McL0618]|uniref:GNAT family N-acetyltransferase n=1 Tax=Leifsonia sp. McL0618 TaxID=3415677 RepID=UPI003CEA8A8C
MISLDSALWPPAPIITERLIIRASEPKDRDAVIELFSSAQVNAFVGGPQPRSELEAAVPETPGQREGFFIVEHQGNTVGIVTFDPRDSSRPGPVQSIGGDIELGYMLLPQAWGKGYATEACSAAVDWFATTLPGEPLVASAQVTNEPSIRVVVKLGFEELERHEEFGSEQWFGVWRPQPKDRAS